MFIAAIFTIAKSWKQHVSIDRWMDKEAVVYMHNEILLSHEKEWNFVICSNMDGPEENYAKWNKSDTER